MATAQPTTELTACPLLPNGQMDKTCLEDKQFKFMEMIIQRAFSNDVGCTWFLISIMGILSLVCVIIGLIGNIFTMATLRGRIKKSGTIFLMFCLAATDLVLLLSNGPFVIAAAFIQTQPNIYPKLELTNFGSSYLADITNTFELMNIWLTVIIMWHRYRAINSSYIVNNGDYMIAGRQVLAVVITSVLVNIPHFLEEREFYITSTGLQERTSSIVNQRAYTVAYKIVFYYMFYYVIPMTALLFFTIRAKQILSRKMASTQNSLSATHQHEMTVSLIRVTSISLFCYMMPPVRRILLALFQSNKDQACGGIIFYFSPITILFSLFNSASDFFIYILCVRRFRNAFTSLFNRKRSAAVAPLPSVTVARTTL